MNAPLPPKKVPVPAAIAPELEARWKRRGPALYVPALLIDSQETAVAALLASGLTDAEAAQVLATFTVAGARLTLADRLPAAAAEITALREQSLFGCWLCLRQQVTGGPFDIFVGAPRLAGFDAEIAQDVTAEMRRLSGQPWTVLVEPVDPQGLT